MTPLQIVTEHSCSLQLRAENSDAFDTAIDFLETAALNAPVRLERAGEYGVRVVADDRNTLVEFHKKAVSALDLIGVRAA